ncbi:MAG: hypothetical protein U0936_03390 [Planctomycetaceae bacterium]
MAELGDDSTSVATGGFDGADGTGVEGLPPAPGEPGIVNGGAELSSGFEPSCMPANRVDRPFVGPEVRGIAALTAPRSALPA